LQGWAEREICSGRDSAMIRCQLLAGFGQRLSAFRQSSHGMLCAVDLFCRQRSESIEPSSQSLVGSADQRETQSTWENKKLQSATETRSCSRGRDGAESGLARGHSNAPLRPSPTPWRPVAGFMLLPSSIGHPADWTSFRGANLPDWPSLRCEIGMGPPFRPAQAAWVAGARAGRERAAHSGHAAAAAAAAAAAPSLDSES
jgi:hypothetical protein